MAKQRNLLSGNSDAKESVYFVHTRIKKPPLYKLLILLE